jgi:uncharacterized phage-associated protein
MQSARTFRVVEAAMAILQATPGKRLGITVLNKALFYAELCTLRDTGQPLTGFDFLALPQGPVLAHYERALVRALEKNGLAEQAADGWEKPVLVRRAMEKFDHLTAEERGIAELVARKIHDKSATWVSEYSHENLAWQHAFRIGVGTRIDMDVALQQVVEDDPWMDEDVDAVVEESFKVAEQDTGVPF